MTAFKNFSQLIAALEDGRLNNDLTILLKRIAEDCTEHADNHGAAKAKLKLTLDFKLKDGVFEIFAKADVDLPKEARGRSIMWLTGDHDFAPHNPRQMSIFGPRDAAPPAADEEVRAV